MAGRRTNLALLLLVPAAALTGLTTFLVGSGPIAPVVVAHGLGGLAVLVLFPWESEIARRGLRRRRPGRDLSVVLTALVLLALASGLSQRTGMWRGTAELSALQWVVAVGLGGWPLTSAHVRRRRAGLRAAALRGRLLVRVGGVA